MAANLSFKTQELIGGAERRQSILGFYVLLLSHQKNRHQKPIISVAARSAATLIIHWEGSSTFSEM
ncbi:hypothetical protein Pse7429DRAFT_0693 [Pseudanabaena biceps PCC 7429]|uniref:Uncharacterized protein n=1 Tax=Pseudanabaena biceps PCC 7429 TaxID=927668 RepID=L8N5S1_9CYAN|nr:hypothetical protein Pse7429DRAFT_0693 [Pseudanabaena biceps PCC 7429]